MNGNSDVLDPRIIQDLRELGGADDPELLNELVGLFLADAPARIRDIENGITSGDVKTVERAAHTLKSSSANIGAMSLSAICRQIEDAARTSKLGDVRPLLASVGPTYDRVALALKQLVA